MLARRTTTRRSRAVLTWFALTSAALVIGCSGRDTTVRAGAGQFRGVEYPTPLVKPSFTLTATDGTPFDFRRETDGRLTLLFFGYTHCPDVCPVHLSNIGAVLRTLGAEDRARIRVVFVTTDPDRDSAAVIRRWLDVFDASFVGLRGSLDDVNRVQALLGLPPAAVAKDSATGRVEVGHAAQVIAFGPDNVAHLMYPFGTRQSDWAHDLPLLLRARWAPSSGERRTSSSPSETASLVASAPDVVAGPIVVRGAVIPLGEPTSEMSAYFTLENRGATPDALVSVEAPGTASSAMLHASATDAAGRVTMTMVDSVSLTPRGTFSLAPGRMHLMLSPAQRPIHEGDVVVLQLKFRGQGTVTVPARVIAASDLERAIDAARTAVPEGR
jgi:cytochrome oxidase Cu insertion factor (SCO1/SenC/PrrC family)/copper(I)-binding protein